MHENSELLYLKCNQTGQNRPGHRHDHGTQHYESSGNRGSQNIHGRDIDK